MPLNSIVLIGTFSRALIRQFHTLQPLSALTPCLTSPQSQAPDIRAEYLRWVEIVGEADPYAGPDTLGISFTMF